MPESDWVLQERLGREESAGGGPARYRGEFGEVWKAFNPGDKSHQSHWPHQSSQSHQSHWPHQSLYARGSIAGLRLRPTPRDIEVTRYKNMPLAINQTPITSTGPWELSGHWWCDSYSRHYWEIQTAALQHYLIYHDLQTDRWFLQGVFD